MKPIKMLSLIGLSAALLLVAVACAPMNGATTNASSDANDADEAMGTTVQRAIVLQVKDDTALFADEANGTVYFPTVPAGGLFGMDGAPIDLADLQPGNIVEVTGNGIMLESYPGQYPGIERIALVEEGSPDSVAPYQDVLTQVFAEPDPYAVPSGYIEYRTDMAATSVALDPVSSTWDASDGFRKVTDGTIITVDGLLRDDVPNVRIGAATEATIGFGIPFMDVQVSRQPLIVLDDGKMRIDGTSESTEEVPLGCASTDEARLMIEPGFAYTVNGFFEHGNATYGLITTRA